MLIAEADRITSRLAATISRAAPRATSTPVARPSAITTRVARPLTTRTLPPARAGRR